MLKIAGGIMKDAGADFIFTGEVLGQRPMSQTKQSLHVVAKNSGYQDYIIRPLSAKLLPETKPEMEGKVDRQRLLTIRGKGRKNQIELARNYGIADYAAPAGGCLLTDPMFAKRLRDLFTYHRNFRTRDIELLKHGRHFRIDDASRIIVGRNSFENEAIERLSAGEDVLIHAAQFPGPTVLVPSESDDTTVRYAASLCALYSDAPKDEEVVVVCTKGDSSQTMRIKAAQREDAERRMI
jgi:tRNA U34 2-thiouridine synthase MnmA/TrmU